jgi:mono/diheme cytochrome c family protein
MTANIIWLLAFVIITGLGVRFSIKLFRPFGGIGRTAGGVLLGLVTVIIGLFSILALLGIFTMYSERGNPVVEVQVEGTAEQVERGQSIAGWACAGCHTLDKELPLAGGKDMFEKVPIPIGSAVPQNLTPAGRISEWTDGELQRAIREGTNPDGHLMPVMSSSTFRNLSQPDLDALVAYLRSQPATGSKTPDDNKLTFLAMGMATLGALPFKEAPEYGPPAHIEPSASAEYGEYVVKVIDCAICHGDDLTGGPGGIIPAGPSLAGAKVWTSDEFISTMRTGVTPFGESLDGEEMPWEDFAKMSDETLTGILAYIKQVDPS